MWIVFLHVAAIFAGFALTTGVGIFFVQIVQSGDVRAIRTAARAAVPLVTAGGIVIIVGVLFGFGAASMLGFSLTARWLIITYVLVALLIIDGFGIRRSWMVRVRKAAQDSPDDTPSAELRTLSADKFIAVGGPISGLLWLGLILMMTLKP